MSYEGMIGAAPYLMIGGMVMATCIVGCLRLCRQTAVSTGVFVLGMIAALAGEIVGGIAGSTAAAFLVTILYVFLRLSMEQAETLLSIAASGAALVGAAIGGRCLYLWVVRRSSPHPEEEPDPEREDVIREYEQWKQQHVCPVGQGEAREPTSSTSDMK